MVRKTYLTAICAATLAFSFGYSVASGGGAGTKKKTIIVQAHPAGDTGSEACHRC